MSDIEDAAIDIVAKAVTTSPSPSSMAAGIMRLAGSALARLTSHEQAFRVHTDLARRHHQRIGRGKR